MPTALWPKYVTKEIFQRYIVIFDFYSSFKQNPAFDPTGMLRRTDSKESNCSSIQSMAHHREDLRQTLSVPASAFHVSDLQFQE